MKLVPYVYCPIRRVGAVLKQYPDSFNVAPEPDFIAGQPQEDWNYPDWHQDRHGQIRKGNILKATGRYLVELHDVDVVMSGGRIYLVLEPGIVISEGTPSAGLKLPESATMQIEWKDHGLIPLNVMYDYEIVRHESRPSVLYGHDWMNNYFHHLMDTIPRQWAMDEGLLPDDVIIADMRCTATRYKTLYFPSFWPVTGYSPETLPYIREKCLWKPNPWREPSILYLTRDDAATRRCVNEDAVCAMLSRKGLPFRKIRAGALHPKDQIAAVQGAAIIIGPHGAAFTNCLFANGSAIIEFVPEVRQPCCFRYPAKWAGNWYGAIVSPSGENDDMTVDLDVLQEAVTSAKRALGVV